MKKLLKICGISQEKTVRQLLRTPPDFAGFVFAPSKRKVTPQNAIPLMAALKGVVRRVAVVTSKDPTLIGALSQSGAVDVVQLHFDADDEYVGMLKNTFGVQIISVVKADGKGKIYGRPQPFADYILVDAFDPDCAGGGGKSYDFARVPEMPKPTLFAGGIDQNNLLSVLGISGAAGADLSSGAEINGQKDNDLIARLVRMTNEYNNGQRTDRI